MYVAVSVVKMNTCRTSTRSSSRKTKNTMRSEPAAYSRPTDRLARYHVASVKIASSRCPANMFPNSRTPRVNGWKTTYLRISTGIRMIRIGHGAAGVQDLKYPKNPLDLKPRYQDRT